LFYLGVSAALLTAACWTLSAFIYKKGEIYAGSFKGCLARGFLSFISFTLIISFYRADVFSDLSLSFLILTLLSAVTGFLISDFLYIFTIRRIGLSCAVPLASTSIAFSALINSLFLNIGLTASVLVGTILITTSIWLISADSRLLQTDAFGFFMAILGALFWSVSIYFLTLACYIASDLKVNFWRIFWLFLFSIPFTIHGVYKNPRRELRVTFLMGLGGVLAISLGWWFFTYAVQTVGPERAVPLSFLYLIFSVFIGRRILKEKATYRKFAGALIAIIGAYFVSV